MKFSEIITLAKQGFTPADIREFLAAESTASDESKDVSEETGEPSEDNKETGEPEKNNEDQETDESEDKIDYKELYEKEKEKRQKAEAKKDIGINPEKSIEETLIEIAKMYV